MTNEQLKFEEEVEDFINKMKSSEFLYEIDKKLIKNIMKSLPNNKSRGNSGISNEMLKYGCIEQLSTLISGLFEIMFQKGIIPDGFNIGKIIPIVKNNNGLTNSITNIRPINISNSITVVFEIYLIFKINDQMENDPCQVGFTKNGSTQHGIFVLKETAKYYSH